MFEIFRWLLRWLSWPWPAKHEEGEWQRPRAEQLQKRQAVAASDVETAEGWAL